MSLSSLKLETGYWYLATPYSKYPCGIETAFIHAANAAGELLKHGVSAYSPIAHTHPIAVYGGLDPLVHDIWIPLDRNFMSAAYGLLVLHMPTWDQSKGIAIEIEDFEKMGKPVVHLNWPRLSIIGQSKHDDLPSPTSASFQICPRCGIDSSMTRTNGHLQCDTCKQVIEDCCDG